MTGLLLRAGRYAKAVLVRAGGCVRGRLVQTLELSGLVAVVAGVTLVYVPAGLMVAGVLAVAAALALERSGPGR